MDLVVLDSDQAVIGDRHLVGVSRQVLENDLRSTKGRFGIDDPFLLAHGGDQLPEASGFFQIPLLAVKQDLPMFLGVPQE
jgi:hypothetical protein